MEALLFDEKMVFKKNGATQPYFASAASCFLLHRMCIKVLFCSGTLCTMHSRQKYKKMSIMSTVHYIDAYLLCIMHWCLLTMHIALMPTYYALHWCLHTYNVLHWCILCIALMPTMHCSDGYWLLLPTIYILSIWALHCMQMYILCITLMHCICKL